MFYLRKICKNIKKETTSIAGTLITPLSLSLTCAHNLSSVSVEDGNALADTFIDYGVKMREQNDLEILSKYL